MSIRPDVAADWLTDRWGEQRKVRDTYVMRLMADMTNQRWRISPDAIVRLNGKLANGQHRLEAVVKSGRAQSFLVMESNDPELYKIIDCGLKRLASDSLIGKLHSKELPPIARWLIAYENDIVSSSRDYPVSGKAKGDLPKMTTQAMIVDYCESNLEALTEAASFVIALYQKTKLLSKSIGGAIYILGAAHYGKEKIEQFLKKVYLDGGNDAAGQFRNRLISNKGSRARVTQSYLFGLALKALKAYENNETARCLKWQPDEPLTRL